jgi:hypothetical protein
MEKSLLQKVVELGLVIENPKVRKSNINGTWFYSVIDVLGGLVPGPGKVTWMRLKKRYPDVASDVIIHQFPEKPSRYTPAALKASVLLIIFKLSVTGETGREFVHVAAQTFLQALNPSREYIDALTVKAGDRELGGIHISHAEQASWSPVRNTFSRYNDETTLYIRMRKPKEFLVASDYIKELTTSTLKFGLTYTIHGRHGNYARNKDNGYMAFSYHLTSRKEALIIEDIMKYDFSSATVLGSREYLDVTAAAAIIGCKHESESYSSYVYVAQQLFTYMLKRIHMLWPRNAHMFGHSYDVVSDNASIVRNMEDASVSVQSELSFRCNVIDRPLAVEMGIIQEPVKQPQPPTVIKQEHPMTRRILDRVEIRGDLTIDDVEDAGGSVVNDVVAMKTKLDRFVEELCIIDPEGSARSTEISGQYRLWAREEGREIFSAVLAYMGERFRTGRLSGQDKNTVVNGFKGVRLKTAAPYNLPEFPTLREIFLFEVCDRGPAYKGVQSELVAAYRSWMQRTRSSGTSDVQIRSLKDFLKENFFKANIWKQDSNRKSIGGVGFWGIGLKTDSSLHRAVSTTSKRVRKVDTETGAVVGDPWPTIAKAAESVGWCAAKMSRAIRDGIAKDGFKYEEM